MEASRRSLIIGLGLPAAAILVVMPLLANTDVYVLGVPLLFAWMFAWFPLTSLCPLVSCRSWSSLPCRRALTSGRIPKAVTQAKAACELAHVVTLVG